MYVIERLVKLTLDVYSTEIENCRVIKDSCSYKTIYSDCINSLSPLVYVYTM